MPTYTYRCSECGDYDKFQPMSDKPIRYCPKCGKPVIRLIGAGAGVIFKGTGFPGNDSKPHKKYKFDNPTQEEVFDDFRKIPAS